MGILSRAVDYFDNLLADRYTHHVSVEVMRKAAALDVTVYEDPVFYDRLERARVQATDRLAMIQQMGRLIQQTVTAIAFSAVLVRLLSVSPAVACRRHHSRVSRREPLRIPHLCQELPPDAVAPPDGLSAPGGRQQGSGEGTQAFQPERLSDRPLHEALAEDLRRECRAQSTAAFLGRRCFRILGQLGYYGAYAFSILSHHSGPLHHWRSHPHYYRDYAGHEQYPAGIFYRIGRRRSGAFPH